LDRTGLTVSRVRASDCDAIWSVPAKLSTVSSGTDAHVLMDIEYEIEPAVEVVASVRYPHQQFGLE